MYNGARFNFFICYFSDNLSFTTIERGMEEEDAKLKMFLLPFRNHTHIIHYRQHETCKQLFSRIRTVIPYFKTRPFVLRYHIKADSGEKIPITMTPQSQMDVRVLYSDGTSLRDVVRIEEGIMYIYFMLIDFNLWHDESIIIFFFLKKFNANPQIKICIKFHAYIH